MTVVRQNRLNRLQQNSTNAPHKISTACTYYEYSRSKPLRNRTASLADITCGAWLRLAVCSQLLRSAPGRVPAHCSRPIHCALPLRNFGHRSCLGVYAARRPAVRLLVLASRLLRPAPCALLQLHRVAAQLSRLQIDFSRSKDYLLSCAQCMLLRCMATIVRRSQLDGTRPTRTISTMYLQ